MKTTTLKTLTYLFLCSTIFLFDKISFADPPGQNPDNESAIDFVETAENIEQEEAATATTPNESAPAKAEPKKLKQEDLFKANQSAGVFDQMKSANEASDQMANGGSYLDPKLQESVMEGLGNSHSAMTQSLNQFKTGMRNRQYQMSSQAAKGYLNFLADNVKLVPEVSSPSQGHFEAKQIKASDSDFQDSQSNLQSETYSNNDSSFVPQSIPSFETIGTQELPNGSIVRIVQPPADYIKERQQQLEFDEDRKRGTLEFAKSFNEAADDFVQNKNARSEGVPRAISSQYQGTAKTSDNKEETDSYEEGSLLAELAKEKGIEGFRVSYGSAQEPTNSAIDLVNNFLVKIGLDDYVKKSPPSETPHNDNNLDNGDKNSPPSKAGNSFVGLLADLFGGAAVVATTATQYIASANPWYLCLILILFMTITLSRMVRSRKLRVANGPRTDAEVVEGDVLSNESADNAAEYFRSSSEPNAADKLHQDIKKAQHFRTILLENLFTYRNANSTDSGGRMHPDLIEFLGLLGPEPIMDFNIHGVVRSNAKFQPFSFWTVIPTHALDPNREIANNSLTAVCIVVELSHNPIVSGEKFFKIHRKYVHFNEKKASWELIIQPSDRLKPFVLGTFSPSTVLAGAFLGPEFDPDKMYELDAGRYWKETTKSHALRIRVKEKNLAKYISYLDSTSSKRGAR